MATKSFDFDAFRSTAQQFATAVSGKKEPKIRTEIQNLEDAIQNSDVTEFENAVKAIKSYIKGNHTKKPTKDLESKLTELEKGVKQSKGRGNPFSNIKLESLHYVYDTDSK